MSFESHIWSIALFLAGKIDIVVSETGRKPVDVRITDVMVTLTVVVVAVAIAVDVADSVIVKERVLVNVVENTSW
jgi:hypothetical protein